MLIDSLILRINQKSINETLINCSWPMAQGSWLMAHGQGAPARPGGPGARQAGPRTWGAPLGPGLGRPFVAMSYEH